MKNENGITIISLIITIIVMLILTSVVINVGSAELDESKRISFVAYMQTIQTKVDFIAQYEEYSDYGANFSSSNVTKLQTILNSETENLLTTTSSTSLRYFDSSLIASDLDVENINDEIVVDFNTREVISLKGVEYEGELYYTQYNLPGGQKIKQKTEEVTRNVGFGDIVSNIDGLNSTFTITNIGITNGTLSIGRMDTSNTIKWTEITNYTNSGENITTKNITESGKYYFKLIDNVSGTDNANEDGIYPSVELRLTNKPKLEGALTDLSTSYNYSNLNDSTNWAFATDKTDAANMKYYVWIPRYAYQLNGDGKLSELQFLRGTSEVTTSGGYINTTNWTVPEAFTEGGTQKTGVWVQVTSAKQKELDIIDILETGTIL